MHSKCENGVDILWLYFLMGYGIIHKLILTRNLNGQVITSTLKLKYTLFRNLNLTSTDNLALQLISIMSHAGLDNYFEISWSVRLTH